MIMKIKVIKTIIFSALVLILSGCNEFLDINTDPNNPTDPDYALILTDAQLHMSQALSYGSGGLTTLLGVYTHQTVTRESFDAYGIAGADFEIETPWRSLYAGSLENLEDMIHKSLAEEEGDETLDYSIYRGIAKILKAYIFSQMVDVWGDIPFSEALNSAEFRFPVYDNDESIYPQLHAMLDDGIADLQLADPSSQQNPGINDLIYGGDLDSWIIAANSIKLKLYTQVRLVQDVSGDIATTLNAGVFESIDDDFELQYGITNTPENRYPGFLVDYAGNQITQYVSPWFYETMMGMTNEFHPNNPFANIRDPRVPYYFINQLQESDDSENPTEYRHEDAEWGSFITIHFGSISTDRDHANRSSSTMLGIYAVGGKYNDAAFDGRVDANDATGACPQRFLTYKDILFLKAELAQLGIISDDPKVLLEAAMEAAFEKVDDVVIKVGSNQTIPELSGSDAVVAYIEAVLAVYDDADADKKMEIIMTQKWISSLGSAIDQYSDYRRTGFPVMFDPATDGDPLTETSRSYPLSMPWSANDLTLNANAPDQKLISTSGVFWNNNN